MVKFIRVRKHIGRCPGPEGGVWSGEGEGDEELIFNGDRVAV